MRERGERPDVRPGESESIEGVLRLFEGSKVNDVGVEKRLKLFVVQGLFVELFLFVGQLKKKRFGCVERRSIVEEMRERDLLIQSFDLLFECDEIFDDQRRLFFQSRSESLFGLQNLILQILPSSDDRLIVAAQRERRRVGC